VSYATTHASASRTVASKGAAVSFTLTTPGTYDASTDTYTTPTTATVNGSAVRVAAKASADVQKYAALGLVQSEAPCLFFTPTTYGSLPLPGYQVTWNSIVYTARDVDPIAPNGVAIAARIVVVK
jgi:hypothetical protein